jgi:hypothetical protein
MRTKGEEEPWEGAGRGEGELPANPAAEPSRTLLAEARVLARGGNTMGQRRRRSPTRPARVVELSAAATRAGARTRCPAAAHAHRRVPTTPRAVRRRREPGRQDVT